MKALLMTPTAIALHPEMKYGGIERVVLALSKSFQDKKHNIYVAAPADSQTYGTLVPTIKESEWAKGKRTRDPEVYENHVKKSLEFFLDNDLDILHDHTGRMVFSRTFRNMKRKNKALKKKPIVVTPHESKGFRENVVPIDSNNIIFTTLSESQRSRFSQYVDVTAVINNGVFLKNYPFSAQKQDYLFSLGSIEKDKGQDLAVAVSLETGIPLKIGGKIADKTFYRRSIEPYLGNSIEYVGELNDQEKIPYYQNASAFLAPIRINDCFSLVRIEALATGTPVVTLDVGSAREAVKHGQTGFNIDYKRTKEVDSIKGMVNSISNLGLINPYKCRQCVEENFTWDKISDQYLNLYHGILESV